MLRSEIGELCNDGIVGSHNENHIFTEVFFGKATVAASKRSHVNFECEESKIADISLGSNSENSAVTSLSSSKGSLVDDSDMNENSGGASASGCFQERLERDDQITSIKRMKLSVDGPSSTEPDTLNIFTSTLLPKGMVNGVPTAHRDSTKKTMALYIVESSSQGSISSYYLSKQPAKFDQENNVHDKDVSKFMAVNAEENAGKEVFIGRAVASPVSQESFATRLLLTDPSAANIDKSGTVLAEKSLKELDSPGFDVSNTLKMNAKKDPRPFLQSHAFRILVAMGWCIERRKRPSRNYLETVYLSPEGRLFREFPKVWRLCGQILHADRYYLAQEDNDKEWTDISQFCSDLSDMLMNMQEKMDETNLRNVLAHQWCLLDPFVNAVLIERKVGLLRKGETVKAARSFVISKNEKNDAVMALKSEDGAGNQSVHRNMLTWHRDSSFSFQQALTICEGNYRGCIQQPGSRSSSEYDGQTNRFMESSNRETIYPAEKGRMCLPGTTDDMRISIQQASTICEGNYHGCIQQPGNRSSLEYDGQKNRFMESSNSETIYPAEKERMCLPGTTDDTRISIQRASTICEGNYHGCIQQPGNRNSSEYDGQINRFMESSNTETIYPAEKERMCLPGTTDDMKNQSCRMLKDKFSCLNMSSSLLCASESAYEQLCGYHCNVSVADGNVNVLWRSNSDSPHQDSSLVDVDVDVDDGGDYMDFSYVQGEMAGMGSVTLDALHQAELSVEGGQCNQASGIKTMNKTVAVKKKVRRKSRKISEIRSTTAWQNGNVDTHGNQLEVKENFVVSSESKKSCNKVSPADSCLHKIDRKGSESEQMHHNFYGCKISEKGPTKCLINDDDLLVSAIIRNKDFRAGASKSASEKKAFKLTARKKLKNQKGCCSLQPRNLSKVGKHKFPGKWSIMGSRTVLSWLIDIGVIFHNDVIQYRDPKDDSIIKDGLITKDGIICRCCSKMFSVSKFKNHAGFNLSRPCLNLFMESGKPFTLCQLQAWSGEYKNRKKTTLVVRADDDDQNDDSCGLCGDVGDLICCDNCPSTYHQTCLYAEEIPEGSWYCPNCTCWICGELVNDKEASCSFGALKCLQCEHKYHDTCWERESIFEGFTSNTWFCSRSCQEVYLGLNSRVGISNHIADGFCWTVLRCIHDDHKVHSAQRFALKAECNSKLAVALTIMEECFQSMVDPRTGIDMIPHALYNWGSEFARLNFQGFYTVVLEKDDVLLSAASIRVHGATVAEMPLIATCSNYRRQGMCRRLVTAIEEMLISFKVEKLVVSAIPDLVETWTEGFGFIPVSIDEKRSLNKFNLMVFPGAVLLKKTLYHTDKGCIQLEPGKTGPLIEVGELAIESLQQSDKNCLSNEVGSTEIAETEIADEVEGLAQASPWVKDKLTRVGVFSSRELSVLSVEQADRNICLNEDAAKLEDKNSRVGENPDCNLQDQFSKLSCKMSVSEVGRSKPEMACNIDSVNDESLL